MPIRLQRLFNLALEVYARVSRFEPGCCCHLAFENKENQGEYRCDDEYWSWKINLSEPAGKGTLFLQHVANTKPEPGGGRFPPKL